MLYTVFVNIVLNLGIYELIILSDMLSIIDFSHEILFYGPLIKYLKKLLCNTQVRMRTKKHEITISDYLEVYFTITLLI